MKIIEEKYDKYSFVDFMIFVIWWLKGYILL